MHPRSEFVPKCRLCTLGSRMKGGQILNSCGDQKKSSSLYTLFLHCIGKTL